MQKAAYALPAHADIATLASLGQCDPDGLQAELSGSEPKRQLVLSLGCMQLTNIKRTLQQSSPLWHHEAMWKHKYASPCIPELAARCSPSILSMLVCPLIIAFLSVGGKLDVLQTRLPCSVVLGNCRRLYVCCQSALHDWHGSGLFMEPVGFVRHPMYAGLLYSAWGLAAASGNPARLLLALVLTLLLNKKVRNKTEKTANNKAIAQ